MLALRLTKTVDVDMWNYWHFALGGTLVYYSTGSFWLGLLAAGIIAVVILKLADWSAPMLQRYFDLEGISLPTLSSAVFFPIGLLGNLIIEKIPVIIEKIPVINSNFAHQNMRQGLKTVALQVEKHCRMHQEARQSTDRTALLCFGHT